MWCSCYFVSCDGHHLHDPLIVAPIVMVAVFLTFVVLLVFFLRFMFMEGLGELSTKVMFPTNLSLKTKCCWSIYVYGIHASTLTHVKNFTTTNLGDQWVLFTKQRYFWKVIKTMLPKLGFLCTYGLLFNGCESKFKLNLTIIIKMCFMLFDYWTWKLEKGHVSIKVY